MPGMWSTIPSPTRPPTAATQQITVTITGTDDSSVITGIVTGAVTEGNVGDAPVTATGSIAII